jgi:penicillin-binding protein 1A
MKKSVRIFWRLFIGGFLAFVLLVILCAYGVFGEMPSLKELENPSLLQTSEVYAVDGTLMGKYYLEKGNRSNVQYKDLSKYLIDALVATEDERFYSHSGIDYKRTLSAVAFAGSHGGASTITEQSQPDHPEIKRMDHCYQTRKKFYQRRDHCTLSECSALWR